MSASERFFKRAQKIIPSGVNSPVRYFEPYPFFVRRADGGYVWDVDGKRYVDLCNGYGALLLGHRRQEIIDAVTGQLRRGTLYCAPTEQEVILAEIVRDNFPSMKKIRLVNTGSEATMTAIRLARGFTGRKKIIKFEGCYHGAHDSVLVRAGSGSAHQGISTSDGGLDAVSKNTIVIQYNNSEQLETVLSDNPDIACVIMEPVPANMGLVLPERGFLRKVRRLTKRNGSLLIFDEVVTGFRVSAGGAQGYFGVRPDMTTLAKALGNGFAIAAVGGPGKIMDMLSPNGRVYQASTFAGNPIAVSAAIASIRTINRMKNRLYSRLEKHCTRTASAIRDAASAMNLDCTINHISSMMQVFFSKQPVTDYATSAASDAKRFDRLFQILLERGVFVAPSRFETVFFSDAHTERDLLHIFGAYDAALRAVRN